MFLKIILNFFIGILVGFILELVFRSIENKKIIIPKLINLQMYGLIGASLVFTYYLDIRFPYKLVILFVVPTCIEFLTGYIYLKIKKVYLWNYFDEKDNFMGLICPKFSTFWFLLSLVYYFTILPSILRI